MKNQFLSLFLSLFLFGIATAAEPFRFEENDKKQLFLSEGKMPVLTYQYDIIEHENVPKNNPRRTAGCYVHPLYGLNGEILTDNAPADHFHHHGVFWTWTHVGVHELDGKTTEYSLWESNTALKQHFVRWIDRSITDESATFTVENGWFIGDPKDGKKIMTERVKMIVHRIVETDGVKNRSVDFEFQWEPTDKPITLRGAEGKSYGGFTIRFKPFVAEGKKLAEASEINRITIPTGIAKADLPETPLPWADYTSLFFRESGGRRFEVAVNAPPKEGVLTSTTTTNGAYILTLDGQRIAGTVTQDGKPVEGAVVSFVPKDKQSGATIFIPKTHPDFPPTWLTRYYGPLCVGWPGVKGKTFQPGEKIALRYRVWIHEGAVTVPQIEKAYGEYNKL
jgi:hypothetical protein